MVEWYLQNNQATEVEFELHLLHYIIPNTPYSLIFYATVFQNKSWSNDSIQ